MTAKTAIFLAEHGLLPDWAIREGMRRFIAQAERQPPVSDTDFALEMARHAIAEHTEAANAQHYELPAEFFAAFLGPSRKYSCCLYPTGAETLAQAEDAALAQTAANAGLADGQDILELGCGWGSLSLWMARQYPRSRIVSVSNSASQRRYIEAQAMAGGLENLHVVTADANIFLPDRYFDRIVSVEMFEHLSNWRPLLIRLQSRLKPAGALLLHIFAHPQRPARYEVGDGNWMSQYFFTGGIMPSAGLIHEFRDLFTVRQQWRWTGTYYQRTAEQWLENFDTNQRVITPILQRIYGREANVWRQRWRMFFLATAESFGYRDGDVWAVYHYLLERSS